MPKTAENPLVRARIAPRRKRNAEAILSKLGISPGQAINMLYAQIELKHGLPFPVLVEDNSDVLTPIEVVAETWGKLDNTDYSYLAQ
jgi:addiction module RelB/DinJ family antitoxin